LAGQPPGYGTALAVRADGKIVVGGYDSSFHVFIVRLDPDGAVDASFGDHGVVWLRWEPMILRSLKLPSDGGVLLSVVLNGTAALYRLRPDGSLDASFGTGGELRVVSNGLLTTLALDTAERILVAHAEGSDLRTTVIERFVGSGALDVTFGQGGGVRFFNPAPHSYFGDLALAIGRDDSVYLSSKSNEGVEVRRFDAQGNLDDGFGQANEQEVTGEAMGLPSPTIVGPDGAVYVISRTEMARYVNGARDTAFAVDTSKLLAKDGYATTGFSSVVGTDRKPIWLGAAQHTKGYGTVLARFLREGQLDPSFGEGGIVLIPPNQRDIASIELAGLSDGRIVVLSNRMNRPPQSLDDGELVVSVLCP
jgi:uncharacterized delta-60 repeat protein